MRVSLLKKKLRSKLESNNNHGKSLRYIPTAIIHCFLLISSCSVFSSRSVGGEVGGWRKVRFV